MTTVRVAVAVPRIRIAQPMENAAACLELIRQADSAGVQIICFPQLCLTGFTAGDLLCNRLLLDETAGALDLLASKTAHLKPMAVIGYPARDVGEAKPYNAMAFIKEGRILDNRLDTSPPSRWFLPADPKDNTDTTDIINLFKTAGIDCPVSLLFPLEKSVPDTEGIILCPSAIEGRVGALKGTELKLGKLTEGKRCAAILASAGEGESSTDYWYPGMAVVAENGKIKTSRSPFCGLEICDIAVGSSHKRVMYEYTPIQDVDYKVARISKDPFMCGDTERKAREAFMIQCGALRTRLENTGINRLVLGVSGGLDSTLALLVCVKTLDMMGLDRKNLTGITMPGFGTTDRTYNNALSLMRTFGIDWREIDIKEACMLHLRDIGHDPDLHNSAYENVQARERTQILMNVANDIGALVVGTGDLSELALGWCTYNGDHMSMYAVNCGIPKTAIAPIIRHAAENELEESARPFLNDVINTPISPELLPGGNITHRTEEIIGPYRLHDFFMWHFLCERLSPKMISTRAAHIFADEFTPDEINRWLKVFLKRFFSQQFKRSCMPDGPAVFGISLSPRGGWTMPSDISSAIWLKDLE